jgi:hypothetical protein
MTSKAEKLLEAMRSSKSNWRRSDLDRLYKGFGFEITHGSNHDIIKHPIYSKLRTTLPRHRTLAKGYVEYAVKLIDQLLELRREGQKNNG